jgi:Fe-S-cluster containining protein
VVQIAVDAAAERGETISCRAACGACCRQLVPITPAEAHDTRDLIAALPLERRRTVEGRFESARAKLVEAGLHDTLMHPETVSEDDKESVALRYFALGIPCPFLEAESCSIHPERPIACREYLVTSDPTHCATPTADTIRMVPLAGEVSTAVARADGPSDGPAPWVPLIVAPEWSASNPDRQPPAPAAELLQRVLEGLAG